MSAHHNMFCACYVPTEAADSIIPQRIYCPTLDSKNRIPAVLAAVV